MRGDFENRFKERMQARREHWEQRMERRGKYHHIWTGAFLLLVGVAACIKIGNPDLPRWLFSWKTFLIALGLFIGAKHGFRGGAWAILIIIGGAALVGDVYPDVSIRPYIWPGIFILMGLMLMFRPRRGNHWKWQNEKKKDSDAGIATVIPDENEQKESYDSQRDFQEDFVDTTSIFGGAKKNIISKNFKGGDLVNIFGGTELDLTRADFNGTAVVELTTIFGGTKFIVPSNWTVRSEAVTIFGGLEDKRNMHNLVDDPNKVLLLKGTVIFGGIEIKSF